MPRGRTENFLVVKESSTGSKRMPDDLIVEEPMTIQLDGHIVSTTMRTPGHDYELAVGFCFADGLLHGAPVTGVRYCASGSAVESQFNVVTVETGGRVPVPDSRLGTTTSSCGLCGSQSIDELCARLDPLERSSLPKFDLATLLAVPDAVMAEQPLFAETGAVHAAAAFDTSGRPVLVREDVGRHNAVDKVVGRLVLDTRLPAHDLGLFVSGRASFEMVQKAWAAGFGTLVSVSAPTALAVSTARRAGLTLYGFTRGESAVRYSPA